MFGIKDLIVFLILFGANLLQAITGFAGTLISMPPTIKLIGADEAKALLNSIAQISSLMIVCTGFKHINWKEFGKIFVCMIIGMTVGVWIYSHFPLKQLLVAYGMMIVVIALKKLISKNENKKELPQWFMICILLAAGMIHGMFVSGGALLVVYATLVLKDKEEFRATVALIWVTTGFYITIPQALTGGFNSHVLSLLIVGVIPVFAGTFIGTKMVKKISQDLFMNITYILLLLSGIMAIV